MLCLIGEIEAERLHSGHLPRTEPVYCTALLSESGMSFFSGNREEAPVAKSVPLMDHVPQPHAQRRGKRTMRLVAHHPAVRSGNLGGPLFPQRASAPLQLRVSPPPAPLAA